MWPLKVTERGAEDLEADVRQVSLPHGRPSAVSGSRPRGEGTGRRTRGPGPRGAVERGGAEAAPQARPGPPGGCSPPRSLPRVRQRASWEAASLRMAAIPTMAEPALTAFS